jgi:hypothetical protein
MQKAEHITTSTTEYWEKNVHPLTRVYRSDVQRGDLLHRAYDKLRTAMTAR